MGRRSSRRTVAARRGDADRPVVLDSGGGSYLVELRGDKRRKTHEAFGHRYAVGVAEPVCDLFELGGAGAKLDTWMVVLDL